MSNNYVSPDSKEDDLMLFTLDKPLYDKNTYLGRFKSF